MTAAVRLSARLTRFTRARPRLLVSFAVGLAAVLAITLLQLPSRPVTRLLIGWDAFTSVYLILTGSMIARSDIGHIRRRAAENDDSGFVILALVVICILASLVAIIVELATAGIPGEFLGRNGPPVLAFVTVLLSWFFTHVMFAVHYAHDFYTPEKSGPRGGLEVPGTQEPNYSDFLYFSFVIGCAAATADINITSRSIRKLAAVHGVLSFAYNTAIVALTINVAASRFGS